MTKKYAILIAGPTACGKSSFAIAIAKQLNGVIINADAMQVYQGLQILTARPTAADEAQCPHWLFGHVPAGIRYSAGTWLKDAKGALQKAYQHNLVPIFVGGTGLYFKALTEGFTEIPEIEASEQATFLRQNEHVPTPQLYVQLNEQDPLIAPKLQPNDRQRILRALMVLHTTGQSLADWQRLHHSKALLPLGQTIPRLLLPSNRDWLYQRINTRVHDMVRQNVMAEVHTLLERDIGPNLPSMRAIGVQPFRGYLQTGLSLEQAIENTQRDSRRYAKRQMTWQRNQMASWPQIDPIDFEHDATRQHRAIEKIQHVLEKEA